MKTIEFNGHSGVRNDVSLERFTREDLSSGVNIELDKTGRSQRRSGTTALNATPTHSLWAEKELALCVRSGTLQRLNPDFSFSDLSVAIDGTRVAYTRIMNEVFLSDGIISGVVGPDGYRQWGITPPPAPTVEQGVGDLAAGRYLVTMTYLRADGRESGASPVVAEVFAANQSLVINAMPVSDDPTVTRKRVYASACDGELPYLVAEYDNSDTLCVVTALPAQVLAVRTLQCGPAPSGHVVGSYNGCTYVAQNNYLWYSLPYEPELFHRFKGFLGFTSPVRTFAAVSDGIFLGSDEETVFLRGDEPEKFKLEEKASYGTVLGTETFVPGHLFGKGEQQGKIALWMSKQGLCAGMDGGQMMNLTGERYSLPDGVATGASLLKLRGKSPQLVTTLFS